MRKKNKRFTNSVRPMLKFIAQEMNRQIEAKNESHKKIWHDVKLILEAMTDQPFDEMEIKPHVREYFFDKKGRRYPALNIKAMNEQRRWFDRQWSSEEKYKDPLFAINHFNDLAKKNPVTLQVSVGKTKSGQLIPLPTHKGDTSTATMLILLWECYFQGNEYERLKRCLRCKKWFVDETRNKSQKYCTHHCGDLWWDRPRRKEAGHDSQKPQKKVTDRQLRKRITLQEAMKLNGIEDWELTPSQERYLIKSTEDSLIKHNKEWFQENQGRLKAELKIVFQVI